MTVKCGGVQLLNSLDAVTYTVYLHLISQCKSPCRSFLKLYSTLIVSYLMIVILH